MIGKVNVKYDEDLIRFEVERTSPHLWSYARFHPVYAENLSVQPLEKRALEGHKKALAALR